MLKDWLCACSLAVAGQETGANPGRLADGMVDRGFCWRCITCVSWLACDPGDAVWLMHRRDAIAGKPAPTKAPGKPQIPLAMHHLWELACLRSRRRGVADAPQGCHRGQARSHKGYWQGADSAGNALPVGAGLPAMRTTRSVRQAAAPASRASPLPQQSRHHQNSCSLGRRFECPFNNQIDSHLIIGLTLAA